MWHRELIGKAADKISVQQKHGGKSSGRRRNEGWKAVL